MRFTIKATNIEHTNAIDAYLMKKLRELDRVLDPREQSKIARLDVGMHTKHHKQGNVFYAEITLNAAKKSFRAVAHNEDLYAAIDEMKDEIIREVREHHERVRALAKGGAREMKRRVQKA